MHPAIRPQRRDRISDAALDSIAAEGVAGTSYRKVALLADVPLYTLAGRNPDFRSITQAWMSASRRSPSGTSIPPPPADSTPTSKA